MGSEGALRVKRLSFCANSISFHVQHAPLPHPPPAPLLQWSKEGAAKSPTSPTVLADLLIDRGLELNSRDNMSAVIVKLRAAPDSSPETAAAYSAEKAKLSGGPAGAPPAGGSGGGGAGGAALGAGGALGGSSTGDASST